MHQHHDITLGRIQQFADKHLAARIYPEREPVKLSVYAAPGRISYAGALQGAYRPAAVGEQFGPPWSTHWFKVEITIPRRWRDREVHLLWDSSTEACVWHEGEPQQGLSGAYGHTGTRFLRTEYRLTRAAAGGEQITLMVEVACNGLFGVRPGHFRDPSLIGFLRQAEIAIFDQEAWHLYWDFRVIADMAQHLTPQTPRGGQALYVANRMVNLIDLEDRATWPAARALAAEFLGARNGEGQHDVSAVGHGHLDTAWLWPIAETVRKCVRTFSTAIAYMDDDPEYKFACSQAQQYEWIKDRHPGLYARLKEKVAAGQFVPVGGTWVEPDCNLPSGESLVRQFLFGQRFFRQEFGITCRVFWQPDVFGYSAALPQIMHGAGIDYFFSQKLSWNQFNQPPHHTFLWEGLDGSRVLVHFPPTDTYSSMAGVADLVRTLRQFKDHERARESLLLFGYGDGGGGPTRGMLEQLRRVRDVDGLPRVEIRSPEEFFARCAADIQDPAVWVGELYFELHRATYTTQAQAKLYNRRCESLLHDVEFLAAVACARHGAIYPAEPLARLWKLLLTLQFHDILPGSSIAEVYREAMAEYGAILDQGRELRAEALGALVPPPQDGPGNLCVINTLSFPRTEVVELPDGVPGVQQSAGGRPLGIVSAPPMGYSVLSAARAPEVPVTVVEQGDEIVLENAHVRATLCRDGSLASLFDKRARRECVTEGAGANRFVIFDDRPLDWDAWDVEIYHLETRHELAGAHRVEVLERGPLRAAVSFSHILSERSRLEQTISLTAISPLLEFSTEVEWHEAHKFLKVEFPLDIRAQNATYEIQFGHIQRPTHFNTTWDLARFEVCAHRWADLSEPDFGVALLNDCKYGHATHGNVMRLSLLRAPADPDPEADRGHHVSRYALFPHPGSPQQAGVVRQGLAFNTPLLLAPTRMDGAAVSFFAVDHPGVIIDTVKQAEDSDALILRLYEAHGSRTRARLISSLPVSRATTCNLLEEDDVPSGADLPLAWQDGGLDLILKPFQILTLKVRGPGTVKQGA